jgi:hypothetical protein
MQRIEKRNVILAAFFSSLGSGYCVLDPVFFAEELR